jgi:hypothetical protein
MATYVKNQQFVEDVAHKVHDLSSDALTYYLTTNAAAPVVTNSVLADITEISYTNLSTRVAGTPTTSAQTTGTYLLLLPDLVLTATGAVATFRWVGLYNDTSVTPTDALISYWDYGSDLTLADTETLTIDFTTSTLTIV